MFQSVSGRIINFAVKQNAVKKEEAEEYAYGLNLFFTVGINMITTILIGCAFGMLPECLLFFLIFKVLRKYTGGYHADSAWVCYLQSFLIVGGGLLFIRYGILSGWVLWTTFALSFFILLWLSPVEAVNKRLDEAEQAVFSRRARIRILLTGMLFAALALCGFQYAAKIVCVSLFVVSVLLVLGKWKLMRFTRAALAQGK